MILPRCKVGGMLPMCLLYEHDVRFSGVNPSEKLVVYEGGGPAHVQGNNLNFFTKGS